VAAAAVAATAFSFGAASTARAEPVIVCQVGGACKTVCLWGAKTRCAPREIGDLQAGRYFWHPTYRSAGLDLNGLERYVARWLPGAGAAADGREQRESGVTHPFPVCHAGAVWIAWSLMIVPDRSRGIYGPRLVAAGVTSPVS
jgi:hypothetical protein